MARIPYREQDLAQPADIVQAIRTRRCGTLLNLDRMLLHSPAFARGWNAFLGPVRGELELAPQLRELAMCAVAVLNGAEYEFHHHAPEFLRAGGTREQVDALRTLNGKELPLAAFDETGQAALRLAVEMTREVRVSDATFALVRAALRNDQLVVELVGVIAAYNMVSRFLVALDIEAEEEK